MDKKSVAYKNHFKKKAPSRAEHLESFKWKPGESGNPMNRLAQIRKKIAAGEELTPEEERLKNLAQGQKSWEPGQSGNPKGKLAGTVSLIERLKAYLRRHPEEVEAIVLALVKQGKVGNMVATKEMLDRIDGKVVERHEISGELPVRILFVPAEQIIGRKVEEIESALEPLMIEEKGV